MLPARGLPARMQGMVLFKRWLTLCLLAVGAGGARSQDTGKWGLLPQGPLLILMRWLGSSQSLQVSAAADAQGVPRQGPPGPTLCAHRGAGAGEGIHGDPPALLSMYMGV